MNVRTKQQVVTEFRCGEILQAARKVFGKRGFNETTVDDIAAAAGLAKATVYQYFPSKQEIYLAALRQGVTELAERTHHNMDAAQGIRAKLETFLRTRLEYLEEHRDFFAVYHAEFGNITHAASLSRELKALYHKQLDYLEGVLEQAMKNGEIGKVSAEMLATTVYESTKGVMLRRLFGWSETTVEQDVAGLMDILWKGIGNR